MNFRPSLTAFALASLAALAAPALSQEVNIYSHRQPELIQPLAESYTKETGVKINIAYVGKGMAERLTAEGARSPADLVLTVDIARLTQIVEAGVVQPVSSKVLHANIPPALRDENDLWFALTTRARIVYASKERVAKGEPASYEELADPKWKGRICIRSGLNDYNLALISAQIAHHGEDAAKSWLEGIKANLARKPQGGDRDQVKAIAAGQCDIAVGNSYYIGQMLQDPAQRPAAESVRIVFPRFENGGTHINVSGVALTKAAPNKAEAIRFMEWLTSDKAQQIYAETNNEYPVKAGVARSNLVASWGEFDPDGKSLNALATLRPAAVKLVEAVDFDG